MRPHKTKTGGGAGTNQYQTRGVAKVTRPLPLLDISAMHQFTQMIIAQDATCPPEVLEGLAEHPAQEMRVSVAGNPNTPPAVLARLATDTDEMVRTTVARNPNIQADTIAQLAQERSRVMDTALSNSVQCPGEVLSRLAWADPPKRAQDCSLMSTILAHPNCPAAILADAYRDRWVRNRPVYLGKLLRNPNCPVDILAKAIRSTDLSVRKAAAANPSTPEHLRAIVTLGGA